MTDSPLFDALNNALLKQKRRYLLNKIGYALPMLAMLAYAIFIGVSINSDSFKQAVIVSAVTMAIALIIWTILLKNHHQYRSFDLLSLLLMLNKQFPELEHSAQLLLKEQISMPLIQKIQQNKVKQRITLIIEQDKLAQLTMPLPVYNVLSALFIAIALYLFPVHKLLFNTLDSESPSSEVHASSSDKANLNIAITQSQLTVEPPLYTNAEKFYSTSLDLKALEASKVSWQLSFSQPQSAVAIEFADNSTLALTKLNNGDWYGESVLTQSGVYTITTNNVDFKQIHTVTIVKDRPPRINIVTPKATVTPIAPSGKAGTLVDTLVQVSDDHGLGKVEILASIAKGSGEAVKFRDQNFSFDEMSVLAIKNDEQLQQYSKLWRLTDLDMEPGDELYFTVVAYDNKVGEPQSTRSMTKIIRWLEEGDELVMSDGVLIDFMPEYFKSQRQIIIETKQLIQDRTQLSDALFVETSELLGVAQSSLKERYGQYLGDEFEDGSGINSESEHSATGSDEHEEHDQDEEKISEALKKMAKSESLGGHDHGNGGQVALEDTSDKSGYSQTITTYGHNHEDVDIGVMGQRDPKALMKLSLSNMWQAELHLMLSEPEKALPFEEQALKYLKMAKKADRIYVKRLGFEPPPVTEERRYQGERDDILTKAQSQTINLSSKEYAEIQYSLSWLNRLLVTTTNDDQIIEFNGEQIASLRDVRAFLQDKLVSRPALISALAIVESLLQGQTFTAIEQREQLISLRDKLWQIMPYQQAPPRVNVSLFAEQDPLMRAYLTKPAQEKTEVMH